MVFNLNLYSSVFMEKGTCKPQEQDHGHLVSPQAFSSLFEFFYHSPWWKTEDVPFADKKFKEKKKQISSLLNTTKVCTNVIILPKIENDPKNGIKSTNMYIKHCVKTRQQVFIQSIFFSLIQISNYPMTDAAEQPMLIVVIYLSRHVYKWIIYGINKVL